MNHHAPTCALLPHPTALARPPRAGRTSQAPVLRVLCLPPA